MNQQVKLFNSLRGVFICSFFFKKNGHVVHHFFLHGDGQVEDVEVLNSIGLFYRKGKNIKGWFRVTLRKIQEPPLRWVHKGTNFCPKKKHINHLI